MRFECNRRGHYSLQCQYTTVAMIQTEAGQFQMEHTHQYYVDTAYLITVESIKENIWEVKVSVDNSDKI